MADMNEQQQDINIVVKAGGRQLQPPALYRVVIKNDDYTPMEFVVRVLERFFDMNTNLATNIMLQVHNNGRGICGIFSKDIAETKVTHVNNYAQENEHPLLCSMEKE